jgi:hypothetical protein
MERKAKKKYRQVNNSVVNTRQEFMVYDLKKKVKSAVGAFYSTEALWLIVLLTPTGVPSFISRGAAHQRRTAASAIEGRNYRWNLANNPVIHVSC